MTDPKKKAEPGAKEVVANDEAAPPAPEGAAAAEESRIEEVRPSYEQLEALQRERDELRDQLLRRRADFENYRKRTDRERTQAGEDAVAALLRELIPTLDNIERALAAGGDATALRRGIELTHRELTALLERHGVSVHDPAGEPFDPERHHALLHEAVPGHQEGKVVEVFRKGYTFKDRLLRPALVKVAKGGREPGPDSGGVH